MTSLPARAVVVGASAGGLDALLSLLPALPPAYPLSMLVVIHLPRDKQSIMAELLAAVCRLPVREAEDKEPIAPSTVYIAPPDYHLLVEADKRLSLSTEEPVCYSRPSIDVLFETAADAFGPGLIGVILTGANEDGAQGLKAVTDAGGIALVQDPAQAYSAAMPRAALDACPQAQVMTLEQIAMYLLATATQP